MKADLSMKLTILALFSTLLFGLSSTNCIAQDVERPERNESGSIAPERVKEREVKMPSDPSRFIESEANKVAEQLSKASIRRSRTTAKIWNSDPHVQSSPAMSAMAANTPSGATSINEQARNLYRIEARRLAASKRLLNSNDFLKAFMLISNSRLESNPQANLRLLLDNKLLNNRSYESTLRQNMGFSRDEAQAAIKLANAQMN